MFMNDCEPKYSTNFPVVATSGNCIMTTPAMRPMTGMMNGLKASEKTAFHIMKVFVGSIAKWALASWSRSPVGPVAPFCESVTWTTAPLAACAASLPWPVTWFTMSFAFCAASFALPVTWFARSFAACAASLPLLVTWFTRSFAACVASSCLPLICSTAPFTAFSAAEVSTGIGGKVGISNFGIGGKVGISNFGIGGMVGISMPFGKVPLIKFAITGATVGAKVANMAVASPIEGMFVTRPPNAGASEVMAWFRASAMASAIAQELDRL
mmetsp:Transcript_83734/g.241809  ORF Transcript_83734/g.241809 Transcript_83734/m.241809 type:complete len:269 (-) Transcript_83734:73-879(-)